MAFYINYTLLLKQNLAMEERVHHKSLALAEEISYTTQQKNVYNLLSFHICNLHGP